jgi:hypothetical protein
MAFKHRQKKRGQDKQDHEATAVQRTYGRKVEARVLPPASNIVTRLPALFNVNGAPLRQRALLEIQQQCGNRHAQRLLVQRLSMAAAPAGRVITATVALP